MTFRYSILIVVTFFNLITFSQNELSINKYGDLSFMQFYNENYYVIKTYNVTKTDLKLPSDVKCDSLFYSIANDSVIGADYIKGSLYLLLTKLGEKYLLYTSLIEKDFSNSTSHEISNKEIFIEFPSKIMNRKISIVLTKRNLYERGFFGNNPTIYSEANKNNWLNFRFTNIKYGTIVIENKKLQIGLYDIDNDGDIDLDKDFIFTSMDNVKYFSIGGMNRNTTTYRKNVTINFSDSVCVKIDNIDFSRGKLYYSNVREKQNNKNIDFFYKSDNSLNFETLNNATDNINNYLNKGKYVFIDIWTSSCRPCIKGLPILDSIANIFKDKITIISLLDKDDNRSELPSLVKEHNISHLVGWSNDKLNYKLVLNGYPHGVLFDSSGNLIAYTTYRQLKKYICDSSSIK